MRTLFIISTIAVTMTLATSPTAAAQGILGESVWKNQDGSLLYIENIDSEGQITGIYINWASGYNCQGTPYPVTGWVYGTAITFTVKWENTEENCQSLTAWTGFYADNQITTFWELVEEGTTSTDQILQGEDVFTQISSTVSKLIPE